MKKYSRYLSFLAWALILGCSPAAPQKVMNPKVVEKINDLTESFNPQVDVLFVVDDSGSMDTHQTNFSKNVDQFMQSFVGQNLNYHLGIITSDAYEKGNLTGSPLFIENSTPNGIQAFARNIRVGTSGSGTESFFQPLMNALSPQNLSGHNKDFIRSDSFLVIVFITDAEDQSDSGYDAKKAFDQLVKLKGHAKNLLAYGVIIPTNYPTPCSRDDSDTPVRLETFLGMFSNAKNNIMGLCDVNYGDRLAQFSKDIANAVGSTIFLKQLPVISTIHVMYGNQEIKPDLKKGWSYDLERNAVILGDEIDYSTQPVGTRVSVTYDPITD